MDQIPFIADKINVKMPDFSFGMLIFGNYTNPLLWLFLNLDCKEAFVILLGVSPLKMVVTYFATFALVVLLTTLIGMIIKS